MRLSPRTRPQLEVAWSPRLARSRMSIWWLLRHLLTIGLVTPQELSERRLQNYARALGDPGLYEQFRERFEISDRACKSNSQGFAR